MSSDELARAAATLSARLGHRFTNPRLLHEALTHTSAAGQRGHGGSSYERLEFLGDRVLALVVADLLLQRFPRESEGALARRHAALVRRETLAEVARELGLGEFLVLARGEEETGGRDNPALLADVCEALIGALYLDGGLDTARRFIEPRWRPLIEADRKPPRDAKTALQEWAQGHGLPLPEYSEVERRGPPHDPEFTVQVAVEGHPPESGAGRSKRLAEQEAARRLLDAVTAEAEEDRP